MTPPPCPDASERFRIHGRVGAPIFATWITRHARKLGLSGAILRHDASQLDLALSGPPDLLDAMELGCSLGPQEVWVEKIDRTLENAPRGNEFSSTTA